MNPEDTLIVYVFLVVIMVILCIFDVSNTR